MNAMQTNSRLIGMNEAGITSGRAAIHILGSGAAADCIIIAGYAAGSKQLFLVHATRLTNITEVKRYIKALIGDAAVYISSTAVKDQAQSSLLSSVRDTFPNAKEFSTGSLAIDAQSGEVASEINLAEFGKPEWMLALTSKEPKAKMSAKEAQKYRVVEIPSFKPKEGQVTHAKDMSGLGNLVGLEVEYYDSALEPKPGKAATRVNEV